MTHGLHSDELGWFISLNLNHSPSAVCNPCFAVLSFPLLAGRDARLSGPAVAAATGIAFLVPQYIFLSHKHVA